MNKCEKCGHESNDDVTDHVSNCSVWRELAHWNNYTLPHKHGLSHHWYCKKCQVSWTIVELNDPTWFLEGQNPPFRFVTPPDPAVEFNFGESHAVRSLPP